MGDGVGLTRNAEYGFHESGEVVNQDYHQAFNDSDPETVDWDDSRLDKITRFRILSDPGHPAWDVSYVHGMLKDGSPCEVRLPFSQMPKRGWKQYVVQAAKRDGVYAKGLGIFDAVAALM